MSEKSVYDVEVKRMRDEYGPDAESPRRLSDPYGKIGMTSASPTAGRIAELSKELAEAALNLAAARERASEAIAHRSKSEAVFAQVSDALLRLVNEHREGTPENVPYQP